MAEAHPVGLPVGDGGQGARRDGHPRRPALQPHQRAGRPASCRCGPGSDIAFLGGIINHVLDARESDFREYVLAYTNAPTIIDEEFQRCRGPDGLFSGLRPASTQPTTPRAGSTRARTSRRRRPARPGSATADGDVGAPGARRTAQAAPTAHAPAAPRPDAAAPALRLPDPQAPLRPLHARDGRAGVRRAAGRCSCRSASCSSRTPGASAPTAFVYGVGWTQHTVGSQYIRAACDPAAAARQHRPARRRHHGDARARLDPGLERHPDPVRPAARLHPDAARSRRTTTSTRSSQRGRAEQGFWANMRDYMVSLLKAWWGDAATAENDFCFDYLPRLTGEPQHLRHRHGADRGDRARATSCSARTRPSARPTRACSGWAWPSSTGWSCATSR